MTQGSTNSQANYTAVTRQLAVKALAIATDTAPHRAKEGESRWSLAELLPAARVLIEEAGEADREKIEELAWSLSETLSTESGKVTDGFGHSRAIYQWFAVYQLSSAGWMIGDHGSVSMMADVVELLLLRQRMIAHKDPRIAVWRRLVASFHNIAHTEATPEPVSEPRPLVPLGIDDLIDAWTYRELVGLHGLYLSGSLRSQEDDLLRANQATLYHLGHTQPDYTTYQPWGLAAFASDPMTAVFAEQQLHDVATHLSIEGPGGAVMPALLLADCAATMSGTLTKAWRRS